LATDVFLMDFPGALAVFLHEHAHIFGYDGRRGFTHALTELIETIVRERQSKDEYDQQWTNGRQKILEERKTAEAPLLDEQPDWLATKTESELRELLRRVLPVELRKLRQHHNE
jgi:hypothetical protein